MKALMLSWHPSAHPGIILSQEEKLQHSREGIWPGEGTTLKAGSASSELILGPVKHLPRSL